MAKYQKQNLHNINENIRTTSVRLVDDETQAGIYPIEEALRMAKEAGVDLVEISSKTDPPIVRIVDYKKFLYEQKKKQKELKSKLEKTTIKEIRFGPHTEDHDFNFKKKHAEEFLKSGAKVKVVVQFKGREIVFKNQGEILLLKFAQELIDLEVGGVESLPSLEGKKMTMVLKPKKK